MASHGLKCADVPKIKIKSLFLFSKDFRKEHEDLGYSASSRSSKPNTHTLKSSTSSRSGTMVEKAMSAWKANSGTVENTDNKLHLAPCSPDRRSYNSSGFIGTGEHNDSLVQDIF